jgi:hypothetical protein
MMTDLNNFEVWFVTGSQHLYGEETLKQVAEHSKEIADVYDDSKSIPVRVIFKPVLKTPDEIYKLCQEANNVDACVGIIAWMHTFSPAKMWIGGLKILQKPITHSPSAHPIQQGYSLVNHRHGFYESKPVSTRWQGVWIHQFENAPKQKSSRRSLAG